MLVHVNAFHISLMETSKALVLVVFSYTFSFAAYVDTIPSLDRNCIRKATTVRLRVEARDLSSHWVHSP